MKWISNRSSTKSNNKSATTRWKSYQ